MKQGFSTLVRLSFSYHAVSTYTYLPALAFLLSVSVSSMQGIVRFEPAFADKSRAYSSALVAAKRVFVLKFINSPLVCQEFCDGVPECRGFMFIFANVRLCVGVTDLGDPVGIPVADVVTHLRYKINRLPVPPICMKKHFATS